MNNCNDKTQLFDQDLKRRYQETVQKYETMLLGLNSKISSYKLKEQKLICKAKNLEATTINLNGMLSYIREEANQLFMALSKMLLLYDNFSSLQIKTRLFALVRKINHDFQFEPNKVSFTQIPSLGLFKEPYLHFYDFEKFVDFMKKIICFFDFSNFFEK